MIRVKTIGFAIGIAISVIGIISYFITDNTSILYWICGVAGALGIFLSGILIGAFLSGSELRGNYFSETATHRNVRTTASISFLLFSVPNLIVLAGFYFF